MSAALIEGLHAARRHAEAHGHVCILITITVPHCFHAQVGGKPNPSWNGVTPKEAHQRLLRAWAWARAVMAREGTNPYGLRLVEPHSDGTPHRHLLAFVPSSAHARLMRSVIARRIVDEPGLYFGSRVAMLELKMIGAAALARRHFLKSSEARVQAWAATWGIRMHTTIGLVESAVLRGAA